MALNDKNNLDEDKVFVSGFKMADSGDDNGDILIIVMKVIGIAMICFALYGTLVIEHGAEIKSMFESLFNKFL